MRIICLSPGTFAEDADSGVQGRAQGGRRQNDEDMEAAPIKPSREYRKVPEERLEARLGLSRYNVPAPLKEEETGIRNVVIKMSQHIGSPSIPVVSVGDMVKKGDMIGKSGNGLSVRTHASIDGKVTAVEDSAVTIQKV